MRTTADRTVSVELRANVKPYLAAMAQAEAATKRLREGMGDAFEPWDREVDKQSRKAPKDAENIAGSFGKAFSKRLEAAFKSLPQAKITADSSQADIEIAQIREKLLGLADKRIGIDMDAASALMEIDQLQRDLERLKRTGATIDVQADTAAALAELKAIEATVAALNGQTVAIKADVDAGAALAGLGKLATVASATAAIPVGASLALGIGALTGPLAAAGLGFGAFAAIAVPAIKKVQEAVDKGKFDDLSEAEMELAKGFIEFGDAYDRFQKKISPDVWPVITGGLNLIEKTLPTVTPLIKAAGSSLLELEKSAQKGLNGPAWNTFIDNVSQKAPAAITGFGRIGGDVFRGLGGIITAFLPYTDQVIAALEKGSTAFGDWGQQLGSSNGFREFLAYVQQVGPDVIATAKNLGEAGVHIVEGFAPLGVGALSGLRALSDILAGMSPDTIRNVATAVAAVYGAVKTGQLISAGVTALSDLRERISSVGDASSGAKGKIAGLAGILGSGGPWGAALAAGVTVVGLFATRHAEAEQRVRELTDAVREDSGAIGENTRAKVANILQTDGLLQKAKDLGINVKTFTDAALGQKDALAQVNSQLQATASNVTVYGGRAGAGTIATKQLTGSADELSNALNSTNSEINQALEAYRLEAAAKGESTAASGTAAQALGGLGRAAATTAGQVGGLNTQIGTFNASAGGADAAAINFKGSVDRLAASLRENGRTFDINSEKGRTNRQILIETAEAAAAHAAKVLEQTDNVDKANAVLNTNASELRAVMRDAGLSESAIDKLIKKYLVLPKTAKTDVSAPGAEKSIREAERLAKLLNDFNGKTYTAKVKLQADGTVNLPGGLKASINARGGIIEYAAQGGITQYAAGGMKPHIVSKPSAIIYGEGSSGKGAKEAFIPLDEYQPQAIDLLGKVADHFGLALFNKNAAQTISDVSVTLDATNMQIAGGLTSAMGVLESTLGQAGSLTSSIANVGKVGSSLTQGWLEGSQAIGDATVGMSTTMSGVVVGMAEIVSTSVDGLTGSVYELTQTIASIDAKSGAVGASASKSMGSLKGGAVGASAKKSMGSLKGGSVGASASKSMGNLKKASGVAASATKSMGSLKGGVSASATKSMGSLGGMVQGSQPVGGPVNASKVSKPQQIGGSYGGLGGSYGAGPNGSGTGSVAPVVNKSVTFNGTVIKETVDADLMWAKADLYTRG